MWAVTYTRLFTKDKDTLLYIHTKHLFKKAHE